MKQYMAVIQSEASDYAETGRSQEETHSFQANNNDEAIGKAKNYGKDCDVLSITLIRIAEEWHIDLDSVEQQSELSLLRQENEALKADADIVKDVMGVITKFTGIDPRTVEPTVKNTAKNTGYPYDIVNHASLQDISVNLLNEAVRKKVKELSCAQK